MTCAAASDPTWADAKVAAAGLWGESTQYAYGKRDRFPPGLVSPPPAA
ncbi:MAG: hypothetical protein QF926_10895 [Alphaproteobacteria bacterium]|jgi:hypothetical protein|nr:hypothetical protein [Alphaproteobacteria bacterium]MDP6517114.1 hypothetical protein [Alphaproteobacteria bacterium]